MLRTIALSIHWWNLITINSSNQYKCKLFTLRQKVKISIYIFN